MHAFTNADTFEECPLDFTKLRLIPHGLPSSLEVNMATMFNEEAFCDMTFRTRGGDEIKAHKVVICSASEVLRKAMTSEFLVGTVFYDSQSWRLRDDSIQEAQTGYYELPEETYEVVSRFVQFCYLGRYDSIGPATTKHFQDRQLQDREGVINSLPNGSIRIWLSQWPRRPDRFSSGAFFHGGHLQAEHEENLPSAEKLAHELNGRRFCLDVAMWRLADMYDVQALKSHAFEQLKGRLYEYLGRFGTADPILYAIAPIYGCTGSGERALRPLLLSVLEVYNSAISRDPLLWSRLFSIAVEVDEFGQDYRRIFDITDRQWQSMFV